MPSDYRIHPAERLVVIRIWGESSAAETAALASRLYADPAFDPSYNTIADTRRQARALSREEIEQMARVVPARGATGPSRRAAILCSSDVVYGTIRMFQSLADERTAADVDVFRDMDEALDWVGVERRRGRELLGGMSE